MAFISIFCVLGICFWGLGIPKLKVLTEIITMFIMSMTAIVGAYVGFSTWNDKTKPK